ncbi:MAG: alpha/beta hydrolase [Bacteroidota bacterium]
MKFSFQILFLMLYLSIHAQQSGASTSDYQLSFNAGQNALHIPSEGETLTATLFLPEDYEMGTAVPVMIVDGPWTQVKEQVGYTYARVFSELGMAALAFDHRFWGESSGTPRSLESTRAKQTDLTRVIDYLSALPAVDPSAIYLLGVCAGAGTAAGVVANDDRLAGFATIAAWLQHPSTTPLFYGGIEGVEQLIEQSDQAQNRYESTGQMPYVAAYDPAEGSGAAMNFPSDYYGMESRGAVSYWTNQFAIASWREWLTFNAIDGVAEAIDIPTIMVHSDQSALPDNVRKFYDRLPGKKRLVWGVGQHTDFYDQPTQVHHAVDEILNFFNANLN